MTEETLRHLNSCLHEGIKESLEALQTGEAFFCRAAMKDFQTARDLAERTTPEVRETVLEVISLLESKLTSNFTL